MLNTKVNIENNDKTNSIISPKQTIELQQDVIIQDNPKQPIQNVLQDNSRTIVPRLEFSLQFPQPFGVVKVQLTHNDQFVFLNSTTEFMGQFDINNVFSIIKKTQNNIDEKTKQLIEMTILTTGIDNKFKLNATSPFMNDIDILIELNKIAQKNAVSLSPSDDNKIIHRFVCMLIEHTLNTISIVSKKLKDTQYDNLKNKLMRYSTGLVYKVTCYIQQSLISSEKQYSELKNTMEQIKTIETRIEQQINSILEKNINKM